MSNLVKAFEKEGSDNVRFVSYKGYTFTTINYNGEVLFWGKEICEYLEYEKDNVGRDIQRHTDDDERILLKNKDIQNLQNGRSDIKLNNRGEWFINELGLYGLILGSQKTEARDFKKWVKQTIKQIREKSVLEAFEAFRVLDKEIQKHSSDIIARYGKMNSQKDNIRMNKNVNEITSLLYQIKPSVNKKEMEEHYPEMLIDRQRILQDYCTMFKYIKSHTQTKEVIMQDVLKEAKTVA